MIDLTAVRSHLLSKTGAEPTYPFGPQPLVVKVVGKMFALLDEHAEPLVVSLKCDPYHGQVLRDEYVAIQPGYHLNKQHWISITMDGSVPDDALRELMDESYALVVRGLTKMQRQQLATVMTQDKGKAAA